MMCFVAQSRMNVLQIDKIIFLGWHSFGGMTCFVAQLSLNNPELFQNMLTFQYNVSTNAAKGH